MLSFLSVTPLQKCAVMIPPDSRKAVISWLVVAPLTTCSASLLSSSQVTFHKFYKFYKFAWQGFSCLVSWSVINERQTSRKISLSQLADTIYYERNKMFYIILNNLALKFSISWIALELPQVACYQSEILLMKCQVWRCWWLPFLEFLVKIIPFYQQPASLRFLTEQDSRAQTTMLEVESWRALSHLLLSP